jgi:NADPH:quinone reductase-like Zn-dependent oxidoreductase
VERLAVGDRVFGLVGGGGYAEAVVVHERTLARIPDGMSFEDAAAIPEAFITAYDAIVVQGELAGGRAVLVHAVGSGVGSAAVQLGRALGAFVVGTARTPDKLDRAREFGMHAGIAASDGRFADQVLAACPDGPAVVLELVGGNYVAEDIRCVQPLGRIVVVGLLAGTRADVDLGLVLRKRVRILGTVLRSRPLEEKIAAARTFEAEIVPLLARRAIAPVIDTVMDLDKAAEAHVRMASNAGFGKIVLRC